MLNARDALESVAPHMQHLPELRTRLDSDDEHVCWRHAAHKYVVVDSEASSTSLRPAVENARRCREWNWK